MRAETKSAFVAKPIFVVSSGRSGTAMLHKVLAAAGNIEMHHEYMVHSVQKLAVKRYLGLADARQAKTVLASTHGAAIHYAQTPFWGDSSNKLSWLIPELAELFPNARFLHLVRDGRKVAGSYFRKLGAECYDDRSTAILQDFYDDPANRIPPPPEKKYWWPVPRKTDPAATAFRSYDQFSRIAWHWAEINRVIGASLAVLPAETSMMARLEDLRVSPAALKRVFAFLGLSYSDAHFALFSKPHNVNRPVDQPLSGAQRDRFDSIAGTMMARLGYAQTPEYVVNY